MTTLRKLPDEAPPPSHVEEVKFASHGLGGTLFGEIDDAALDHLSEDATHILKFHGGGLTAEQYLLADELAGRFGNGTLRITSRQDFQFHGVGKARLKPLISALNERWISTYGGCGDVGRNTVTCPVADLLPGSAFDVQALARQVGARLMPASTAYYELWLDGERVHEDGTRERVTHSRAE